MLIRPKFPKLLLKEVIISNKDLSGYFSSVYHEDPENFSKNIIVETDINEVCSFSPYTAINPTSTNNYFTDGGYLLINVKKEIFIKSYKILSENNSQGNAHLKTWQFLGSTNGNNWVKLHSESNYSELNGRLITKEFKIKIKRPFSYFKILKTDDGWNPKLPQRFGIQKIEIFLRDFVLCSTIKSRKSFNYLFVMIFIACS